MKMKRIFPILLIIIGVLLILTPFITDQIIQYYTNSVAKDHLSNETLKANNQNANLKVEFDFSAVEDVDIQSILKGSINFNKDYVIGSLHIPDLDITLPIMKGLSHSNLLAGAATMKPDQHLGEGNYTLAGHRMKNQNLLFGRLMDIEIGSMVYLSDGENIYAYKIYDTAVKPDTATEMLSDQRAEDKKQPILSLMTCYYSSKTGKRFFALGELVDQYPAE